MSESLIKAFSARGWRVRRMNIGRAPSHGTCYLLAQKLLGERNPKLTRIRFNKVNCEDVVTTMLLAPVS